MRIDFYFTSRNARSCRLGFVRDWRARSDYTPAKAGWLELAYSVVSQVDGNTVE